MHSDELRSRVPVRDRHTDLTALLGALQSLLLTGPLLEEFLQGVAILAAEVVQPAASCGITTRYDGHPVTIASSDDRGRFVDEQQYTDNDGTCLETLQTGAVVSVPDPARDERWDSYRHRAVDLGIKCSLRHPLIVDGQTVGAMNLYGYDRPYAFDDAERHRAETPGPHP